MARAKVGQSRIKMILQDLKPHAKLTSAQAPRTDIRGTGRKRINIRFKTILLTLPLIIIFFILHVLNLMPHQVDAQNMSSENYSLHGGNLNMAAGKKESLQYQLQDIIGQTSAGTFASNGFVMQSGFLNAAASSIFSITISPILIDFGILTPDSPIERPVQITITNGNMPGYNISIVENHPLSTLTGSEIKDTACDQPQDNKCTISQAAKWSDKTTYGFGFRMEGNAIAQDFGNEDFYRPFPATSRGEKKVLIMSSKETNVTDQAIMTLKLNTDPIQAVGEYSNLITITAVVGI